jgi:hypothetical protein
MRTFPLALLVLAVVAASPVQNGPPINAMCPIKPNQKARASITAVYKGQVIGFC